MMARRVAPSILCLGLVCMLLGGCVFCPIFSGPRRSENMVLETLVSPEEFWTTDRVLLLPVDGVLSIEPDTGGLLSRPSPIIGFKDALKRAERDPSIRCVLVRISSPGGGVTASDVMYAELMRFKKKTGKKVVAVMMDVAASGGYYVAMSADRVVAHPTTITGSIGVIALFPGVQGLTNFLGVEMRVVKSGPLKDLGSMWRGFTVQERQILQATIDEMHTRFVEVVDKGRPDLSAERVRELADGRIYTAQQAKEAGLIDEIGYMQDAFEAAKKLAGLEDAALVTYRQPYDYAGHYYARAEAPEAPAQPRAEVNLFRLGSGAGDMLPKAGSPFYYLWLP